MPVLMLKEWQQKRPELFVKRVCDQTGLDSYACVIQKNIGNRDIQVTTLFANAVKLPKERSQEARRCRLGEVVDMLFTCPSTHNGSKTKCCCSDQSAMGL